MSSATKHAGGSIVVHDGYPDLSTWEHIPSDAAFRRMNDFSRKFLDANDAALTRYAGKWVADPLKTWSRRWEYMFVDSCVRALADDTVGPLEQSAAGQRRRCDLLDAGSGLTFFPHYLAATAPVTSVRCCDSDPDVMSDAAGLNAPAHPNIAYSVQDIAGMTFSDASFDLIYCISVLEHCQKWELVAAEFARVLRPGGRLIVSIDVSFDGKSDIPRESVPRLLEDLARHFRPDNNYERATADMNESNVLTTDYVREHCPDLLPWRPAGWRESLASLLRRGRLPSASPIRLTCLCAGFSLATSPLDASSDGEAQTPADFEGDLE